MNATLLFLLLLSCFWGAGFPVTRLLPGHHRDRILAAPVFGIAVLAILANVSYRFGIMSPVREIVFLIPIVYGLVVLLYHVARNGALWKEWAGPFSLICAGAAIVLLPAILGKDQFGIFQGNKWDHFNYLKNGLVYGRVPYADLLRASRPEFLDQPLLMIPLLNIHARPGVMMLWSIFATHLGGPGVALGTVFVLALMFQAVPTIAFIGRNLFELTPGRGILAGLVFTTGFWGQYIMDLNAWSQVSTVGVLLLLTYLIARLTAAETRPFDWRESLAIGILGAGALYLYTENAAFHLPGFCALAFLALVRDRRMAGGLRTLAFSVLPALAIAMLFAEGTVLYVLRQFNQPGWAYPDWWRFTLAFLGGYDGWSAYLETNLIDFLEGAFGLYFLSPPGSLPGWNRHILRLAGVGFLALLCGQAFRFFKNEIKNSENKRHGGTGLLVFAGVLLLSILPYVFGFHYWAAGKAFSFAVPYLFLFLLAPIATLRWRPPVLAGQLALWVFCFLQLAFAGARVAGARSPDGIHFPYPYPSVQVATDKSDLRWNLNEFRTLLRTCQAAKILDMRDSWPEDYAMMYLYAEKIPFFKDTPVHPYYGGAEGSIGIMSVLSGYDCELGLTRPKAGARREFFVRKIQPAQ